MASFTDLQLNRVLVQRLQELDYHTPTPIQQSTIPLILQKKDIAGQAETGSGKTAAYALPILQNVNPELQQVQALIIVPTRELAVQVREECKRFAPASIKISAFYGGHAFAQERASMAFPPQVLIGTPGRLADHLNRRTLILNQVRQVVLDEADKLLEMDFGDEIDQLMDALPRKRQTILFSATMPDKVKALIARLLSNPVFIQISSSAVPDQIEFVGVRMQSSEKSDILLNLLGSISHAGTVVFVNTRATADELTAQLQARQLAAQALHGGMEQIDRDKTMTLFRNGTVTVLVATDLAARGLDIANLATIIHYELPDEEATFLHRSGRVGRAGKSGRVYALATPGEERKLREWKQIQWAKWVQATTFMGASYKKKEASAAFATLHIKAGRKEKLSKGDILGALIAETGLKAEQIGKIDVQDHASYVAVPQENSREIAAKLNNSKIKGQKFRVSVVQLRKSS